MSGVKQDCTCPRVHHEHGQWLMYEVHRCGCFPCRLAWSKARQRQRDGLGYSQGDRLVPKRGVDRRLQALIRIGWRHSDISARLSAHLGRPAHSELILKHAGATVRANTHAAVCAVYTELAMRPGPSQRNRNRGRKLGYGSPLSWDDIDTDPEPAPAVPEAAAGLDEIEVERYIAGTLQHPDNRNHSLELVEAVRRMAPHHSDAAIGRRVGISREAVTKLRERNRIPSPRTVTRRETAA